MKKVCLLLVVVLMVSGALIGCTNNENVAATQLTAEELAYFNGNEFFNGGMDNIEQYLSSQYGGANINIRNQFLSSLYDEPEKIDLFKLFYAGTGTSNPISEEEAAAVIAANGWDQEPDTGCTKISRATVDEILGKYMGLTLAETEKIGLDGFTYLDAYDAYYLYHGDTNYRIEIAFSGGEKEGDMIRLFYNDVFFADGEKVLTLKKQDDGYHFVSNVMIDNKQ